MKQTSKEIIESILNDLNTKAPTFAKSVDVAYGRIYDILRGKSQSISSDLANAINKVYPQYSLFWLTNGEGEILKTGNINNTGVVGEPLVKYGNDDASKIVPYYMYKEILDKNYELIKEISRLENLLEQNNINHKKVS